MPGHDFWPDHIRLKDAAKSAAGVVGHRQVVDIYLLALAAAHGGMLATLDRGAAALAQAQQQPENSSVEGYWESEWVNSAAVARPRVTEVRLRLGPT